MLSLHDTPACGPEGNGRTAAAAEQHPAPIIIYGAPRSGTGYLSSILNQHPDVFISPEARLFVWLDLALNDLTKNDRALLNVRTEFAQHLRDVLPQVVRDFYRKLKPTRYWGDKNPHYADPVHCRSLQTIAALFPGARFIHIIRDGRDVVTSILRNGWKDFEKAHEIWKEHVDTGRMFGIAQPRGAYFELHYEELIRDDLGMARSLFEFLEIPLDERVIQYCKLQQISRTPISAPTRDLSGGATGSDWGGFFSPEQRLRSLGLLARHLLTYRYETPDSFTTAYQDVVLQHLRVLISPLWTAAKSLPPEATVLVVSKGDDTMLGLPVRRAWHFPQTADGVYAGCHPANSAEAIAHLEQLRDKGADYLIIPSTGFWWLEYYKEFREHLECRYNREWADEICVVYSLGRGGRRRSGDPGWRPIGGCSG